MRSETDEFLSKDGEEIQAIIINDDVLICFGISASEKLTKDQAREFARQLMEMCGEE